VGGRRCPLRSRVNTSETVERFADDPELALDRRSKHRVAEVVGPGSVRDERADQFGRSACVPRSAPDSACIELPAALFDRRREVRVVECLGHHEIDRPAEDSFELFLEPEVRLEARTEVGVELDEEVDVAPAGAKSPVAAEPKTDRRRTPNRLQTAAMTR